MDIRRNPEIDLFVVLAYETLRAPKPDGSRYDKLHTVWNGFNKAFRQIFPGVDPVKYCQLLADEGCVQTSPAKGGAFLKPSPRFILEAQAGQEELGVRLLRYLEGIAPTDNGVTCCCGKTDAGKRLEELGF